MFAINCSHCGNRSLIFESQVLSIRNDEDGIHVEARSRRRLIRTRRPGPGRASGPVSCSPTVSCQRCA